MLMTMPTVDPEGAAACLNASSHIICSHLVQAHKFFSSFAKAGRGGPEVWEALK